MGLLTTKQVGKLLGISTRRVRDLIEAGKIQATKPGVQYFVEEESLAGIEIGKPGRPKQKRRNPDG
jgi:excisionase family DNA binding protein